MRTFRDYELAEARGYEKRRRAQRWTRYDNTAATMLDPEGDRLRAEQPESTYDIARRVIEGRSQ